MSPVHALLLLLLAGPALGQVTIPGITTDEEEEDANEWKRDEAAYVARLEELKTKPLAPYRRSTPPTARPPATTTLPALQQRTIQLAEGSADQLV